MNRSSLPPPPDFAALEMAAQAGSDERQRFLALIGDLNFAWANNESLLIYLLMLLAGVDERKAAIIHATLNTTRARLDLIQRLAKIGLPDGAERAELDGIVDAFSAATRLRNDLMHATFVIGSGGAFTHTHSMKLQEAGNRLRFGTRRLLDEARLTEIRKAVQDLKALNRRIWGFLPVLEEALGEPRGQASPSD